MIKLHAVPTACLAVGLFCSASAAAQETTPAASAPVLFEPKPTSKALRPSFELPADLEPLRVGKPDSDEGRRCHECPVRRLMRPYFESVALNFMYNGINRLRGHETAEITFKTAWLNLRHGFEWDDNPWGVNQIGHPYQGSNYFTSGRAHGLTFFESTAVAAFGSATWEYLFETNRASLNDLINTTIGGIALGEVMHRVAWLVRDPMAEKGRTKKELIATAIDPLGGLARMTSGDSKRVVQKPADMIPSSVKTRGSVGVMWQGRTVQDAESTVRPFLQMDMDYGNVRSGRSKIPFGAFGLEFTAGGGSAISELAIRGRFFSRPFGEGGKAQFTVFQTFDYSTNLAYSFGGQGVEAEVATRHRLSRGMSLWMAAAGGSTFLGAVDSLVPAPDGVINEDLVARREYDYGPTLRFGGAIELQRSGAALARLTYQGYQISVVDGTRAFHVLQTAHLDVRAPLRRGFAFGMSGEYFFRKAYYWPVGNRIADSWQFRTFMAFSIQ